MTGGDFLISSIVLAPSIVKMKLICSNHSFMARTAASTPAYWTSRNTGLASPAAFVQEQNILQHKGLRIPSEAKIFISFVKEDVSSKVIGLD